MKKISNLGDDRNKNWCIHCGGSWQTDDHVPSRAFLDKPYPENIPFLPSCKDCNQSFSLDEEFVACLLECAKAGGVDANLLQRENIRKALNRNSKLTNRIGEALSNGVLQGENIDRIKRVILKSARGHVAFEQNEPQLAEPSHIAIALIHTLSDEQLEHFETPPPVRLLPEIGSRAMQRLFIAQHQAFNDWIEIQTGRYRYLVDCGEGLTVRMVLGEYLAAEVVW